MNGRCKERVWNGQFSDYPCSRKDWKDGFCKQHHPDSVKKRRDDAYARFKTKWAEDADRRTRLWQQREENAQLNAQLRLDNERLRELLLRIRKWDHLGSAADGPFWKLEIDAALRREDSK